MSLIKLSHLTKIYKSNENVAIGIQDVNLEFNLGEFVAIVGSSGSGKTTLLNVISGMDTYEEGELFLSGKSTSDFTSEDFENYRRANVAFIFQNYQLVDSYSVLENVMIELIFKGFSKKEAKEKAIDILTKVGLRHRLRNRATKLSGGEKQRVVIARAIASDAKILVCDEPTGNLDSKTSVEIMKLLKEISKDKLVLFVTHDESLIEDSSTRIIRIKDGKVESDRILKEVNVLENIDNKLDVSSKNKVSTQLYVAIKNVLRTPKKSFFVFIVFVILCFVLMGSIAFLPTTIRSFNVTTVEYKTYENVDQNRMIVYGSEIVENLPEEALIVEDDYILDFTYRIGTNNPNINRFLKDKAYIKATTDFLNIIAGEAPVSDNEVLLVLDDEFSNQYLSDAIGAKFSIGLYSQSQYLEKDYFVVGIGTYTDEYIEMQEKNYPSKYKGGSAAELLYQDSIFHLSSAGLSSLASLLKATRVENVATACVSDIGFVYGDEFYSPSFYSNDVYDNRGELSIKVSYRFKDKDFSLKLGDEVVDLSKYNIIYEFTAITDFAIGFGPYIAKDIINSTRYRYSVYVPYDLIDSTYDLIKNTSEYRTYAMKNLKKTNISYNLVGILENLLYFVFIFVEVLISLFIVTLITSFVLGTKKKELGVLRVIGLSEKDVLHVLHFELIFLMVVSIGVSLLGAYISTTISDSFNFGYIFDNWVKLVISIVILIAMAYMISFSWNKKMFKKSAREVLKVGDAL